MDTYHAVVDPQVALGEFLEFLLEYLQYSERKRKRKFDELSFYVQRAESVLVYGIDLFPPSVLYFGVRTEDKLFNQEEFYRVFQKQINILVINKDKAEWSRLLEFADLVDSIVQKDFFNRFLLISPLTLREVKHKKTALV